jgi:hypothetical protein
MNNCSKHPRIDIVSGNYYRCADFTKDKEWRPKNETQQARNYGTAVQLDQMKDYAGMALIFGADQLHHAAVDSAGSPYISVARCPICLIESTDTTVASIVKSQPMSKFRIVPRNQSGTPFVFDMSGNGVFAAETESLVLLPPNKSLLDYRVGLVTRGYLDTLR